eukprot:111266-Pyramimonas_sp.AAC.1
MEPPLSSHPAREPLRSPPDDKLLLPQAITQGPHTRPCLLTQIQPNCREGASPPIGSAREETSSINKMYISAGGS